MSQSQSPADPGSSPSETAPPAAAKGSPIRLGILLIILAIVVGVLLYDVVYATAQVTQAHARLEALMKERHEQGVEKGKSVTSADVQSTIGFAPSSTDTTEDGTIEWYCWWGNTPYLARKRRFIWVKYGGDPLHATTFDYDSVPVSDQQQTAPESDEPAATGTLPPAGPIGDSGAARPKKTGETPPLPSDPTPPPQGSSE